MKMAIVKPTPHKHAAPASIDILDAPEMCDLPIPNRQSVDEFLVGKVVAE